MNKLSNKINDDDSVEEQSIHGDREQRMKTTSICAVIHDFTLGIL